MSEDLESCRIVRPQPPLLKGGQGHEYNGIIAGPILWPIIMVIVYVIIACIFVIVKALK